MRVRLLVVNACILFFSFSVIAQKLKIDSLRDVLRNSHSDTDRINALNGLSKELENGGKYDSAITYANNALQLSNTLALSPSDNIAKSGKKEKINSLKNIGIAYRDMGNSNKTIEFFQKALVIAEDISDKPKASMLLNGIGNAYVDMANYATALDYYVKALTVAKDLGDKQLQANALGNIGLIYGYESDFPTSLEYDLQGLKLAREIGNKTNIAADLGNISIVYWNEGDTAKALNYSREAIKLNKETEDKSGWADNLVCMGNIYIGNNNYQKGLDCFKESLNLALELKDSALQSSIYDNIAGVYAYEKNTAEAMIYFTKALAISVKVNDKNTYANTLGNLGSLYSVIGKFGESEKDLKQAIHLEDSLGDKNGLMHFEMIISQLYDTTGRYKEALEYYKKAMVIKDTLFNINKNKAITSKELNYQFEQKRAAEKADQDRKNVIEEQDKKRQTIIRNTLIGGFILLAIFALFVYRSYREKKKDNIIITHQKEIVEEKQKEILDSIHYAQRIQKALLASDDLLKKHLYEYFVLYKPKDIVSGDFYWATSKGNNFYIAVCDSTGHGVPGAFMSLLNVSFLNEAITEKNILQPNEVFNHVRKRLIENISQDGQQDGMDGTLLCFDGQYNLLYAGAYNAPVVVRDGKIIELNADKIPVGKSPKEDVPFSLHSFTLNKGDIMYAFTDGYADQFGGPKGKKFKYKQMQEKIVEVSGMEMSEQKKHLNDILEDWRSELEQVDDILIVGIKVS